MTTLRDVADKRSSHLIFDYLYRDASNYKNFGSIWLVGTLSDVEKAELITCLDGGEFFVAEQIGIPPLYFAAEGSGDPNEDDHAWHTFDCFREEKSTKEAGIIVKASNLIGAFRASKGNWQPELSPNF